ncbi:MAG: hypothetical protein ACRD3G_26985 [Vicinamibacterales bacterium]
MIDDLNWFIDYLFIGEGDSVIGLLVVAAASSFCGAVGGSKDARQFVGLFRPARCGCRCYSFA